MSDTPLAPAAAPPRPVVNPFRGPCPLGEGDAPYLCGRDKEVAQLGDLVLARSEVVFHGPAGRGKTSLVQAGLLPWLRQRACRLLPVARLQGPLGALTLPRLPCVFTYHALMSWAPAGADPARLAGQTLAEFLQDHRWAGRGRPTPLILIFDAFDEFFTTHPQLDRHRDRFFEQLREAFKADPLLRVLFVTGDEYVPRLTQYAAGLPERGSARLRLARLSATDAFAVLQGTLAGGGWRIDERALIALVGLLEGGGGESSILDTGTVPTVTARVVEPLLLQLAGRKLCADRELVPEPGSLSVEAAARFVERYRRWDPDRYLEDLYEEVLAEVAPTSGTPAADVRAWLAQYLVTEPVNRGAPWRAWGSAAEPDHPTPAAAQAVELLRYVAAMSPPLLVTEHALRPGNGDPPPGDGPSGAVCWYELTHELLGPAILSANAKWEKVRQGEDEGRLAVSRRQAAQWEERAKRLRAGDRRALLTAAELGAAEEWRGRPEVRQRGLLTEAIAELVEKSRQAETARLRRQNHVLWGLLALAGALAVVAVFFAYLARHYAGRVKQEAGLTEERREISELHIQILNEVVGSMDSDPAGGARKALLVLGTIDDRRNATPDRPPAEPRTVEELRKALTTEYDDLERRVAEQLNLTLQVERTQLVLGAGQGHGGEVEGVAFGGRDGLLLATACADGGGVRVWHLGRVGPGERPALLLPPSHEGDRSAGAVALAFGGEDRSWLAAAFGNGGVCAWHLDDRGDPVGGTPLELSPPSKEFKGTWNAIAWHPGPGRLLVAAVAGENDDHKLPGKRSLWAWELAPAGDRAGAVAVVADEAAAAEASALAFAPDGRSLVTAHRGGALLAWGCEGRDFRRDTARKPFAGAGAGPALSSGRVAARRLNRLVIGAIPHDLPGGPPSAERLTVLVSAGEDHTARVWNFNEGKQLLVIQHPCAVRGVALDAREGLLATAGRDDRVRLWSLRQQRVPGSATEWQDAGYQLLTLAGHTSMLTDVAFSPARDRSLLASSSDDQTARVWSPDPQPGPTLLAGLYDYGWFAFSPGLDLVAACDKDAVRRPPLVLRLGERPSRGRNGALWRDWLPAAYAGEAGAAPPVTRRVAFAPDTADVRLATLHDDQVLRLWARGGGEPVEADLGVRPAERDLFDPIYCRIAFSGRGRHVAFSLDPFTVGVFALDDARPGQRLRPRLRVRRDYLAKHFPGGGEKVIYGFALDAGGEHLALAFSDQVIHVLDVPQDDGSPAPGEPLVLAGAPFEQGRKVVYAVAYSASGRLLAAACGDNKIRVWDVSRNALAWELGPATAGANGGGANVHTADVRQVAFRPGSDREDELASADDDGITCVWRLGPPQQYQLLYKFGERQSGVQALAYDRTGQRLATASGGGAVRVYQTDIPALKKLAADHLKRVLEPSALPPLPGP